MPILVGNKATHNEILENYFPHNEVLTELHQRFNKCLGQSTLKGEFFQILLPRHFSILKPVIFTIFLFKRETSAKSCNEKYKC